MWQYFVHSLYALWHLVRYKKPFKAGSQYSHSVVVELKWGDRPFILHLVTLWRWYLKVETCQENSDKKRLIRIMI